MRGIVVLLVLLVATEASAERLRDRNGNIRDVPDQSVEFALKDGWSKIPGVYMRDRDGSVLYVYEDLASAMESRGAWKMTDAEVDAYQVTKRAAEEKELAAERGAREGGNDLAIALAMILGAAIAALALSNLRGWLKQRRGR